jgi:ankyrin repeat protein
MVEFLLDHGANPNGGDGWNATPMMRSAAQGDFNIAKLLLARGASINHRDAIGGTALTRAAAAGHLDVVKWLLQQGAEVNGEDRYHESSLSYAAKGKEPQRAEMVRLLLGVGAQTEGWALANAVENGRAEIVRILVQHGADVNGYGRSFRRLLSEAALQKDLPVVRALLEGGADVNARDGSGDTAATLALKAGSREVIAELEAARVKP